MQLYDLVEFQYRHDVGLHSSPPKVLKKGNFVKRQTHLYNKPRAMCKDQELKLLAQGKTRYTRFVICKNGTYQYTNQMIINRKSANAKVPTS